MNGLARCNDPLTAVALARDFAAQPLQIAADIRKRRVCARVPRAHLPVELRSTVERIMCHTFQRLRHPRQPEAMTGEHLVRADHIAIDIISREINCAVCCMLDTVNNDQTVRRLGANGAADSAHIHAHPRDRRGMHNRRHNSVFSHSLCVSGGLNRACRIVMSDHNMMQLRLPRPARSRRAARRMLKRRAENLPLPLAGKTSIHNETKQKLRAALAHKKLSLRRVHHQGHIRLGAVNNLDKGTARPVRAALVVRNGCKLCAGLHHRVERQSATRILKENPTPLKRTTVHMSKPPAHRTHHRV